MALDSASTYADIEAEYRDTAGYRLSGSASLAMRHAVAIRFLLLALPSNSVKGANQVSYSMSLLKDELEAAEAFAVNTPTNRTNVIRADFTSMRAHG